MNTQLTIVPLLLFVPFFANAEEKRSIQFLDLLFRYFCLEFTYHRINGHDNGSGGKFSFKERGWKLALARVIFPLLFLFLLT